MDLRSGPIHRGIREGRAVVDGGREELDGAAQERAEVRLPPFLDRSGGSGFRQTVDASRALVDDLTPLRLLQAHEASVF